MALEIEVKVFVPNLQDIVARLENLGATLLAPRIHERNQLFLSPDQDFIADKIVLRLRQDTESKITYKAPSKEQIEGTHVRIEHETTVGDYDVMDAILQSLGYTHSLFYEKYRTVYGLGAVQIMLDEMPFGNFVEVEGAADALESVLQQLELHTLHRITRNYVGIFGELQKRYSLPEEHITFSNFSTITIDPSLLDTL